MHTSLRTFMMIGMVAVVVSPTVFASSIDTSIIKPVLPSSSPLLSVSKSQAKILRQQALDARRKRAQTNSSSSSSASSTSLSTRGTSPLVCKAVTLKSLQSFSPQFGQIPSTWSYFYGGETQLGKPDDYYRYPFFSIGQDGVARGDMNWNQIDFYKMSGADVAKLIKMDRAQNDGGTWTQEKVGGVLADVLTEPLDNGEVTKGGTGGKTYFLDWPVDGTKYGVGKGHPYDMGLIISKQALGNNDFECGFQQLIRNLSLSDYEGDYVSEFPLVP